MAWKLPELSIWFGYSKLLFAMSEQPEQNTAWELEKALRTQKSPHRLALRAIRACGLLQREGTTWSAAPPSRPPPPSFSKIPLGKVLITEEMRALLWHVPSISLMWQERSSEWCVKCWQVTRQVNYKAQQLSRMGDAEVIQ